MLMQHTLYDKIKKEMLFFARLVYVCWCGDWYSCTLCLRLRDVLPLPQDSCGSVVMVKYIIKKDCYIVCWRLRICFGAAVGIGKLY